MLGAVIQACGGINRNIIKIGTMTNPGYPTPKIQAGYLGMEHYSLLTNNENMFRFSKYDIEPYTNLIMVNYPHNPSGQVVDEWFWRGLCDFCAKNGIRLFNDAAYAILTHNQRNTVMLSEVANEFSDLSWCEAFSASKVIANGTGWRIGAMVGSPDFIGDIATIKGNTDSGFVAPAAAGVIHTLENDMVSIVENCKMYANRISILSDMLKGCGMKIAVEPGAGFFTLWIAPKRAFGRCIADAEDFNTIMIQNTGIVGVPFERYIRYAVTGPVDLPEWIAAISCGFEKAKVSY